MNRSFKYIGCFFSPKYFHERIKGIRADALENDIKAPHITFKYQPEEVNKSLFGRLLHVTIVGYGNNGVNEGLKVTVSSQDPELQAMIDQIEVPHITIAISDNGKPVNTRYLVFHEIEPISIIGRFGGYNKNGKVITKSHWKKKETD